MNKRELNAKREKVYEEIESGLTTATSELDQLNTQLQELEELVESIESRYEELAPQEQEAFLDALRQLVFDIEQLSSPSRLVEYEDDLQEAYRNPILEAVQNEILDFHAQIETDITSDEKEEILPIIGASAKSDPTETYAIARGITREVEDLSDAALSALRRSVRSESPPLSEPKRLNVLVSQTVERQDDLIALQSDLATKAWVPSELEEIDSWPELHRLDIQIETIQSQVRTISEHIDSVPNEIPVLEVTKSHLENKIDVLKENPVGVFEEIEGCLSEVVSNKDQLQEIQSLIEIVDTGSAEASFLNEFNGLTSDSPDNLNTLLENLNHIISKFQKWRPSVVEKWQAQCQIIQTYQSEFDLKPPDDIETHVEEFPDGDFRTAELYSMLIRSEEWIESKQDEILDEVGEDAQVMFRKLSSGKDITLSSDDMAALEELIGIIDIKIAIDE